MSIPRDAVHFTSSVFGLGPHGTVQISSGEAIRNNTSGIETVERKETPLSLGKKRVEIRPERLGFNASCLPERGDRCHTEPQNAVR